MNYKSQLRGWAVDRVIELYKAGALVHGGHAGLVDDADLVAAYAYQADEDFTDQSKAIVALAQSCEISIEQIDGLLQALEVVKEQRVAFDKKEKAA